MSAAARAASKKKSEAESARRLKAFKRQQQRIADAKPEISEEVKANGLKLLAALKANKNLPKLRQREREVARKQALAAAALLALVE